MTLRGIWNALRCFAQKIFHRTASDVRIPSVRRIAGMPSAFSELTRYVPKSIVLRVWKEHESDIAYNAGCVKPIIRENHESIHSNGCTGLEVW